VSISDIFLWVDEMVVMLYIWLYH